MPRKRQENRIPLSYEERRRIFWSCKGLCAHCGKHLMFGKDFTVEHVIPLYKGGTNDPDNLIALCEACNQEKSDDIVDPATYFPYLVQSKMEKATALFNKYMQEVDYLGYDNVFPYDQFSIKVDRAMVSLKSRSKIITQTTVDIAKMRTDDILEFILEYGAHLTPGDKELLIYQKEQIRFPFYTVKDKGKTLMVFATYIQAGEKGGPPVCDTPKKRNTLIIQAFGHPDIPPKPKAICNIANIVEAIIGEVQRSLEGQYRGMYLDFLMQTPHSDLLMGNVFTEISDRVPDWETGFGYNGEVKGDDEFVVYLKGIVFRGRKEPKIKIAPKYSILNPSAAVIVPELGKELARSNIAIEARLQDAKIVKQYEHKRKAKKKNPKRKHK